MRSPSPRSKNNLAPTASRFARRPISRRRSELPEGLSFLRRSGRSPEFVKRRSKSPSPSRSAAARPPRLSLLNECSCKRHAEERLSGIGRQSGLNDPLDLGECSSFQKQIHELEGLLPPFCGRETTRSTPPVASLFDPTAETARSRATAPTPLLDPQTNEEIAEAQTRLPEVPILFECAAVGARWLVPAHPAALNIAHTRTRQPTTR